MALRQKTALLFHLAALAVALGVAQPLHAQQLEDADETQTAAARALFDEGMAAVDRQDFETAVDRLSRSLELRGSAVVRVNLALALAQLGRLVEATEHLRQVRRGSEIGSDANRAANAHLTAIEPRLGRLEISVTGEVDGVRVEVDGQPLPEALIGVAHPVDPTMHVVVLFRGETELAVERVTVDSGSLVPLTLLARPPTPAEAAVLAASSANEPTPPAERIEEQWWFWTILGVLVVGAAIGITIAVLELSGPGPNTIVGSDGVIHMTLTESF